MTQLLKGSAFEKLYGFYSKPIGYVFSPSFCQHLPQVIITIASPCSLMCLFPLIVSLANLIDNIRHWRSYHWKLILWKKATIWKMMQLVCQGHHHPSMQAVNSAHPTIHPLVIPDQGDLCILESKPHYFIRTTTPTEADITLDSETIPSLMAESGTVSGYCLCQATQINDTFAITENTILVSTS